MNVSAGFIRRPIATSLLMVMIVALGILGYVQLPVAALPNVDSPTIQVTLQLDLSRTIDFAAGNVQAAINAAADLPASLLNPPLYRKTNPVDTPILLISLSSDMLAITAVSDYANSILAQKISQLPGVGLVGIGGLQNPATR